MNIEQSTQKRLFFFGFHRASERESERRKKTTQFSIIHIILYMYIHIVEGKKRTIHLFPCNAAARCQTCNIVRVISLLVGYIRSRKDYTHLITFPLLSSAPKKWGARHFHLCVHCTVRSLPSSKTFIFGITHPYTHSMKSKLKLNKHWLTLLHRSTTVVHL